MKSFMYLVVLLFSLTATKCPKDIPKEVQSKIEFDFSRLDANGLHNGERALDYEFCIPAEASKRNEVLATAPNIRFMEKSKGRIGCREGQWLCINSTHDPHWKEQLYKLASLSYVERIIETHYE